MRTWWVGVVSNRVRCVKGSRARKTGLQVGEGEEPELGLFLTSVCVRNKCVAEGCCALLTSSGFIFFPHPPPNTATTSVPVNLLESPKPSPRSTPSSSSSSLSVSASLVLTRELP
ncbi:unnamed protein product [Musa acuminata subsp. burmannicoides]